MTTTPTQQEIEDQANAAVEQMDMGSKWPGMSYEQGVANALNWVLGNESMPPMDEED